MFDKIDLKLWVDSDADVRLSRRIYSFVENSNPLNKYSPVQHPEHVNVFSKPKFADAKKHYEGLSCKEKEEAN